jgi:hypothetical protein
MKPLNDCHRFFPLLLFFIIGSLTVRCAPDPEAMPSIPEVMALLREAQTLLAQLTPTHVLLAIIEV